MINYIKLINFKNFGKVTLDLRGKMGKPKKMIFIYGENGAGKTNILSSILFLFKSTMTLHNQAQLENFRKQLTADNNLTKDNNINTLIALAQNNFWDLSKVISDAWMIENEEPMRLELGFNVNGHNGVYEAEFAKDRITSERLTYVLNERRGTMFHICEAKKVKNLSKKVFLAPNYVKELESLLAQYWGKHSFLAILHEELQKKQGSYIKNSLSENLLKVLQFLFSLSVTNVRGEEKTEVLQNLRGGITPRQLMEGRFPKQKIKELLAYQELLNDYLTSMLSDVKGLRYELTDKGDNVEYKLVLEKMINGKIRDIPIQDESTGILRLLHFFPYILKCLSGDTVVIDEIDNGIHDLMITEFVKSLREALTGQFIASTHNTTLLKELPPETVYFIVTDAMGVAEIVPLVSMDERIQSTNNIAKKYLEGNYGGIPCVGALDFGVIAEDLASYDVQKKN